MPVVDINKATGEVLVFEHPKPDDYYTRPHPIEMCTGFPAVDLDELIPLERYEAVGVFIGVTRMKENALTEQCFRNGPLHAHTYKSAPPV